MSIDLNKLDKSLDLEGMQKDIAEAADGKREYREVPPDTYEVSVESLELKESKAGNLMVAGRFKVLEGEYKGESIFYNQVLKPEKAFTIHLAMEFLRSLQTDVPVTFEGFAKLEDTVMDVAEDAAQLEYALKLGKNKSGYNTYQIEEVLN